MAVAPKVFAMVLSISIDDIDSSMLVLSFFKLVPSFWSRSIKTLIYEKLIDSSTASSIEHRNDMPTTAMTRSIKYSIFYTCLWNVCPTSSPIFTYFIQSL